MRYSPLCSTALICFAATFPSATMAEITFSGTAQIGYFDLPKPDGIFQDWLAKGIDPDSNTPSAASCWVYHPTYLVVKMNDRRSTLAPELPPAALEPEIALRRDKFGVHMSFDPGYSMRMLPLRFEIDGQDVTQFISPDAATTPAHRTDQFLNVLSHLESGQQLVIYETFEITSPPRPSFGLGVTGENAKIMSFSKEAYAFSGPAEGHDLTQLDWFDRTAPHPRFGQMPENGNTSLSTFTFPVSLDGFSEAYQQALKWCGWDDDTPRAID